MIKFVVALNMLLTMIPAGFIVSDFTKINSWNETINSYEVIASQAILHEKDVEELLPDEISFRFEYKENGEGIYYLLNPGDDGLQCYYLSANLQLNTFIDDYMIERKFCVNMNSV